MVSLFCILFLVVFVFSIVKLAIKLHNGYSCDEGLAGLYLALSIIFGLLSVAFLCWTFSLFETVGTSSTVDKKIAMYQEQNAAIEESIDVIVKGYMDFEATTYGELKDQDSISLVSLFPDLKSDTLVQQQIEIYISNNNKIKSLKLEKINLSKAKWNLYFGR